MRKLFYLRLALTNLRKGRNTYFPYLLSCSTIIGLFYMLHAVTMTTLTADFAGSGPVAYILLMGTVIAGMFSAVIIFYTNSFLMKQRGKELGLYSILGMEKRHIARVLLCETALTGALSLLAGMLGGMLLGRLVFLVMLDLLRLPAMLEFSVPLSSVGTTVLLFTVNFLAVMLHNLWRLRRMNPIALLREGAAGEREPRARWILAALGVVTLGAGYILALTVRTPSEAIGVFFFAVVLVIAGTYLLFTAGSIALLKLLRRNRRFYYGRPENFISVSGMIYRMKQNAVGLGNICILSTCVLVTLASTVSLYVGEEEQLRTSFYRDIEFHCDAGEDIDSRVAALVDEHAEMHHVAPKEVSQYCSLEFPAIRMRETAFSSRKEDYESGAVYQVVVLPLSDYNREAEEERSLSEGEALWASSYTDFSSWETLTMDEEIVIRLSDRVDPPAFLAGADVVDSICLVVPDGEFIPFREGLASERDISYSFDFHLEGDEEDKAVFGDTLGAAGKEAGIEGVWVRSIFSSRQDFYMLYGSLLFLGIFFVILFAVATVLIIYYKQISEGYGDRGRFVIMQKVGMSGKEVRSVIGGQVLTVFFLPLSAAVLHVAVAFPVLCKVLRVFSMRNTSLFLLCTLAVILAFTVLYLFVYRATAKTYYSIVQFERT